MRPATLLSPHAATVWLREYCLPDMVGARIAGQCIGNINLTALDGTVVEATELFPGATPFMPWHFPIFGGRFSHAERVMELIAKHSFVAVLGGSGTGKSSLVFAGVLPVLLGQDTGDIPAQWVPVVFKPDVSPLAQLSCNLAYWFEVLTARLHQQYAPDPIGAPVDWHEQINQHLNEPFGLRRIIDLFHAHLDRKLEGCVLFEASRPMRYRFLLVIDQFEESFTQAEKTERDVFFERLSEELPIHNAEGNSDTPFAVLLSMRSEYLESCQEYARLIDAINEGLYILPAMTNRETVEALTHAFTSSTGPSTLHGVTYSIDGSLELWLYQQLENWWKQHGSEQDSLALVQVVMRTLWLEELKHGKQGQFPLTESHVQKLAAKIRNSDHHATLDRLFEWIVTDSLSPTPHLALCDRPVSGHARGYFTLALPLCGVADITFMKFSKRSFSAAEVRGRLQASRWRRFLSFGIGQSLPGEPSDRDIARELHEICQANALLPVLRSLGALRGPETFELCHEAFIRRWRPLRLAAEAVGVQSANAAQLAQSAAQPWLRRWLSYITNFVSMNLPRLLLADKPVLEHIVERARLSLRRAGTTIHLDRFLLRRVTALSLAVPSTLAVVAFGVSVWGATALIDMGRERYAREVEALYAQPKRVDYRGPHASSLIRIFGSIERNLSALAAQHFDMPPARDLGAEYVNNVHVRANLTWTAPWEENSQQPKFGNKPVTTLFKTTPNDDGGFNLEYRGKLHGQFPANLNALQAVGRVVACPDEDASETRGRTAALASPEMQKAEFTAVVLPMQQASGDSRTVAAHWLIAREESQEEPQRYDSAFFPPLANTAEKLLVIDEARACFTRAAAFYAIKAFLQYRVSDKGGVAEEPVRRKFLMFIDPNQSATNPQSASVVPSEKVRRSATAIYALLKEFCGATQVEPKDPIDTVMAKFSSCVPPPAAPADQQHR